MNSHPLKGVREGGEVERTGSKVGVGLPLSEMFENPSTSWANSSQATSMTSIRLWKPLTKITQKNMKCEWEEKEEEAFQLVEADALSINERAKPPKVRALVLTINSNLLPQIHKAQVESLKTEKVKVGNLHGMGKELRLVLIELHALGAGVGYHALET
ncbi:hypothetical protein Tco_0982194 [Tanacetum coccineum]